LAKKKEKGQGKIRTIESHKQENLRIKNRKEKDIYVQKEGRTDDEKRPNFDKGGGRLGRRANASVVERVPLTRKCVSKKIGTDQYLKGKGCSTNKKRGARI